MVVILGSVFASTPESIEKQKNFSNFLKTIEEDDFLKSFLSKSFSNGEVFLHFSTLKNNHGNYVQRVIEFIKNRLPELIGIASFGSILIYDDSGFRNYDVVDTYVLRKGEVTLEKNLFFSPYSDKVSPFGSTEL